MALLNSALVALVYEPNRFQRCFWKEKRSKKLKLGKPDQKVTDMVKFDRRLKIHLVSHSQPLSP